MRKNKTGYRVIGELSNTDRIMRDTFWVGVFPGITDKMVERIAEVILKALEQN